MSENEVRSKLWNGLNGLKEKNTQVGTGINLYCREG